MKWGLTPAIYGIMRKKTEEHRAIFWTPESHHWWALCGPHTPATYPDIRHWPSILMGLLSLFSFSHPPNDYFILSPIFLYAISYLTLELQWENLIHLLEVLLSSHRQDYQPTPTSSHILCLVIAYQVSCSYQRLSGGKKDKGIIA